MAYIDQATADLLGQNRPLGIFWRLDTDPALRFWMGFGDWPVIDAGDYETGFPDIDVVDDKYIGLGILQNMPDLDVLINGTASQVDFVLSGVDARVLAALDEEAPEVNGVEVRVGIAPLNDRWQAMSAVIALWTGVADFWSVNQAMVTGKQSPTNIVVLSCYDGGTNRARPPQTTLTPAVHEKLHPGDLFCRHVPKYRRGGFSIAWPKW